MCDFNPFDDPASLLGLVTFGPLGAVVADNLNKSDLEKMKDHPFQPVNPFTQDLSTQNPELYSELQKRRGNRDQFDANVKQYTDPAMYSALKSQAMNDASARSQNQFAGIGLAGSSAAFGAGANDARMIDLQMQDRQLSDQLKISQMQGVMSGGIEGDISTIQNNFASYQQQQQQAYLARLGQEQQAMGQIWQAAGSVGGALAGSAMGAAGGAGAGGSPATNAGYFGGSGPSFNYTSPPSAPPSLGVNTDLGYGGGGGYSPGYFSNTSVPFGQGY